MSNIIDRAGLFDRALEIASIAAECQLHNILDGAIKDINLNSTGGLATRFLSSVATFERKAGFFEISNYLVHMIRHQQDEDLVHIDDLNEILKIASQNSIHDIILGMALDCFQGTPLHSTLIDTAFSRAGECCEAQDTQFHAQNLDPTLRSVAEQVSSYISSCERGQEDAEMSEDHCESQDAAVQLEGGIMENEPDSRLHRDLSRVERQPDQSIESRTQTQHNKSLWGIWGPIHICKSCEHIFGNVSTLRQHQKTNCQAHACPEDECSRSYATKLDLISHQVYRHKRDAQILGCIVCPDCDRVQYRGRQCRAAHCIPCRECDLRFVRRSDLVEHVQREHSKAFWGDVKVPQSFQMSLLHRSGFLHYIFRDGTQYFIHFCKGHSCHFGKSAPTRHACWRSQGDSLRCYITDCTPDLQKKNNEKFEEALKIGYKPFKGTMCENKRGDIR